MELVQALIYGIVQGLTEFLPISSNAHLRIVPSLFGWSDPGAAFTAIIQLGTTAAVIIYFAKDIGRAFMAWLNSITGKKDVDQNEARMGWAVFVGTIPVIILGVLLKHRIETTFRSLNIIAMALIGMAIVMLLAEKFGSQRRKTKDVDVKDGIVVGLWQCLALVPGMSRSGSTIAGAMFSGFDRVAAARFSFLLSIPSVTGAGLYEAYNAFKESKAEAAVPIHWGPTILATIVSFVVGYASIAFFMQYLQKRGIAPFVWYRIALGVLILVLVQQGVLKPDAGAKPETKPVASRSGRACPVTLSLAYGTSQLPVRPRSANRTRLQLGPSIQPFAASRSELDFQDDNCSLVAPRYVLEESQA